MTQTLPRHTARSIESKWHSLTKGRPRKPAKQEPQPEPESQAEDDVEEDDTTPASGSSTQG